MLASEPDGGRALGRLAELGASAERVRPRLRAPVGLPLGGRAPESVALAIVGQLHQYLHGVPDSKQ